MIEHLRHTWLVLIVGLVTPNGSDFQQQCVAMKQSRGCYNSVGYAAYYFVERKISRSLLREFEIHWTNIQCK